LTRWWLQESMAMRLVFWLSTLTVAYVYAGYPVLLAVWARLRPRPVPRAAEAAAALPTISIVIAARNEAARLPARIGNLLALDYPAEQRQIIVVSDGSSDDTMAVLARYGRQVDAVAAVAAGKAAALNAGVARATGEIPDLRRRAPDVRAGRPQRARRTLRRPGDRRRHRHPAPRL
jgi:cellulose synthase/poly-beta-1,6-N-acetylglucosamine synthase-like glycosyltransferase